MLRREVGWSAENLGKVTLTDSMDVLAVAKNINNVKSVLIYMQSPLTDQYGNTEDGDVMRLRLERVTLDKINFDGMPSKNLKQVADEFWAHPDMNL